MLHSSKRCFLFCGSVAVLLPIVLGWGSTPLRAQAQINDQAQNDQDDQAQKDDAAATALALPKSPGLQILNVSAYFAYYSSTILPGGQAATSLASDAGAGGSVQIGLSRYRERSTLSFSYTPSYIGHVRYSSWNALNHALSLTASRKTQTKANLDFLRKRRLQQYRPVFVRYDDAEQCGFCARDVRRPRRGPADLPEH